MRAFRESSVALLATLAEQVRTADSAGVRVSAHTLAGAAVNLGTLRLARTAKWLEASSADAPGATLSAAVSRAREECELSTCELERRYPLADA